MKNKTLLTAVAFVLSLVTAEARSKTETPNRQKATVEAPAGKNFFQRLFSFPRRGKPAAEPVAKVSAPATKKVVAKKVATAAKPKPKAKTKLPTASVARSVAAPRSVGKTDYASSAAKVTDEVKPAETALPAEATDVTRSAHVAPSWKPNYSDTRLGRAWESAWDVAVAQSSSEPSVEIERKKARITAFCGGDRNSAQKKSSTGLTLRPATETQIGVASGHPEDVGKYVTVETPRGDRTYLIADSGSALVTKEADTENVGEVVDLYAPGGQKWDSYQRVTIVAVEGSAHLLLTPPSERRRFLEWATYRHALAMALKS